MSTKAIARGLPIVPHAKGHSTLQALERSVVGDVVGKYGAPPAAKLLGLGTRTWE